MARFDRSLKTPMGSWGVSGLRATSSFASSMEQRQESRTVTRAGPGFYLPLHQGEFSRYEGPPASPQRRQPLRSLPSSAQMRKSTTRFASTVARLPAANNRTPGPGHYDLRRQAAFGSIHTTFDRGSQPFALQAARSSILDVFPDRRNLMICRAQTTPAPNAYSPVPSLDRLRMSMRNPPCSERIRATPGCTLRGHLDSVSSLTSTLRDLRAR